MPAIKAIIFDCFGVLLEDALKTMCDELAIHNPGAAQEVRDIVRQSMVGLIEPEDSNRQIAALFGLEIETYRSQVRNGERRNQVLFNLITTLRKSYKIGLLSNISRGGLQRRFSQAELDGWFDAIVASADAGIAKPDPAAYQLAASKLGVEPTECIFIDDIPGYAEAARLTGMKAIVYQNFEQFQAEFQDLLSDSKA